MRLNHPTQQSGSCDWPDCMIHSSMCLMGKAITHAKLRRAVHSYGAMTLADQNASECFDDVSKKSPTGPTERTPKPEYLIARSQLTERGPLVRSHSIFDGMFDGLNSHILMLSPSECLL